MSLVFHQLVNSFLSTYDARRSAGETNPEEAVWRPYRGAKDAVTTAAFKAARECHGTGAARRP
jgi:hypothetical protein